MAFQRTNPWGYHPSYIHPLYSSMDPAAASGTGWWTPRPPYIDPGGLLGADPGTTPTKKKLTVPPPGIPKNPLDSLYADAGKYADTILNPYRDEVRRQEAEALADAQNRAQFSNASAAALAKILGGIAPQIQNIYHEASADTSAAAKGFSDGLRASAEKSASEANDLMTRLAGAPADQQISGDRAQGAGDVAYGLGGYIPGQTFAREGAAYASAAALLPNTAIGEGLRQAQQALQAGAARKKELEDDYLSTIAKQRPELIQSYIDSAQKAQATRTTQNYGYAKTVAATFTQNSDHVYIPKQDKNGNWQVVDVGPKTGATTTKQPTNTGPYFLDPTTNTWQLKPGYAPGPNGTVVKVKDPTKAKTPTNTGPWYQDPVTKAWALKPGYEIKNGQVVKSAGPGPAGKTPTPGQVSSWVDGWYTGKATTKRVPVVDENGDPVTNDAGVPQYQTVPGTTTGKLSYQQAYSRLVALKVPPDQARAVLDTRYKRGERGRPYVSAPERAALAKAGLKATASYYKGHAYLTVQQAKALDQVDMLPPGELVNGRYFITPGLV